MPFYATPEGEYQWAPEGHPEIAPISFRDDQHRLFDNSGWCPVWMWYQYYERNNLPAPEPWPEGWRRNWDARCYRARRAEPQPVAPEPAPAPRARPRPANLFANAILDEFAPAAPPPPERKGMYKPPKDVKILGVTKQPFFMPYDSDEEIRFRLVQSVILFNGEPVYVLDVGRGGKGTFNIHYQKQDGTTGIHGYKEGSGFDLTPLPARYILNENKHRKAYWCFRKPVRGVYRQGACNNNTYIHAAGDAYQQKIGGNQQILDAYSKHNDARLIGDFIGRITPDKLSIALSDDVSVFGKKFTALGAKQDTFGVEVQGVTLDLFTRDNIDGKYIKLKYDGDLSTSTIRKLDMVGIQV